MPKVKEWVEFYCRGKVLNLFAGLTRLNIDEVRNDIDPQMPADYHMDAFDFTEKWDGDKFGTIVFDPPYNLRKAREKYGGNYVGKLTEIKSILPRIIDKKGRVIGFGYDSVGMSASRGFLKIAICLICHNGDHNDTIGLVEEYQGQEVFDFRKPKEEL